MSFLLEPFARTLGVPNPWREVRLMIAFVKGIPYESVAFETEIKLSKEEESAFLLNFSRRRKQEPLSKIFGKKEFWGIHFYTTHNTLDPRPDSETLIEMVLSQYSKNSSLKALDLGTGSGCLILSLLSEYPLMKAVALDISEEAILIAKKNALYLGLEKRIVFLVSRWTAALNSSCFDLIISNPPYIKESAVLAKDVLYDPSQALFGGPDGLRAYREIFKQLPLLCHEKTQLIFEIGKGQMEAVKAIGKEAGFILKETKKDLGNTIRSLRFEPL